MDKVNQLLDIADEYVNKNEFSKAEETLKKARDLDPNNYQIYNNLALCAFLTKKYTKQKYYAQKSLSLNDSKYGHYIMGIALIQLDQCESAINHLTHFDDTDNYFSIGEAYEKLKRFGKAAEYYLKAVKYTRGTLARKSYFRYCYAYALFLYGENTKALNECNIAYSDADDSVKELIITLKQRISDELERVVLDDDIDFGIVREKASDLIKTGKIKEGIRLYVALEKKAKKKIEKAIINSDLGAVYYMHNQYSKALDYCNSAVLLGNRSNYYWQRALVYKAMKDYEQALWDIEHALDFDDSNKGNYYCELADIYNCMGNDSKAEECYESADGIGINDPRLLYQYSYFLFSHGDYMNAKIKCEKGKSLSNDEHIEEFNSLLQRINNSNSAFSNITFNKNNHVEAEVREDSINITKSRDDDVNTYLDELENLTGLAAVKNDVKKLINLLRVNRIRAERGLQQVPTSKHLVFSGNPGTGKTTVARILANLYKEIGVLSKGQLVEVDRSRLVAGYVGQTAIQTQEIIQQALGGILFIDEAYTLSSNKGGNDYGQEAIDTILKAMEDNRDDFVVIVAGYPDLMQDFLESNPGLKSRFNKFINFEDYNPDELTDIFEGMCQKTGYKISTEVSEFVKNHFVEKYNNRDRNFANGREVRNFFENAVSNQATRLATDFDLTNDELMTLLLEDVQNI